MEEYEASIAVRLVAMDEEVNLTNSTYLFLYHNKEYKNRKSCHENISVQGSDTTGEPQKKNVDTQKIRKAEVC